MREGSIDRDGTPFSHRYQGLIAARPTGTHPLSPASIPYAVDPHTVERAWFMASRWSAPLYERPGRHGPRLLGSAWVDGVRDGSAPHAPLRTRSRERRPLHPGAGRSPAGGIVLTAAAPVRAAIDSWPLARCYRRGTGPGRAGAGRRQERRPGRGPGRARGAERAALNQ